MVETSLQGLREQVGSEPVETCLGEKWKDLEAKNQSRDVIIARVE